MLAWSIFMYTPREAPPATLFRSQDDWEWDPDVRALNPSAWDSAQPTLSDENHGDGANLWSSLPLSSAMNLPSMKCGRAAAGGASSIQRRGKCIERTTTLSVAHFMGGTKLILRTDPSGGISHSHFRSIAASDVEGAQVNAMQREEDKNPSGSP